MSPVRAEVINPVIQFENHYQSSHTYSGDFRRTVQVVVAWNNDVDLGLI